MAKDFAEAMADHMTTCYASTRGCKKMPVRMIYEHDKDNEVSMVMLCVDHAATYKPEGKVLSDTMLAEGEDLELLKSMSW